HAGRRGPAAEGTGGGERPAQAAGGRAGPGQADAPGGGPGKVLTPDAKRQAVRHLVARFRVSERRACRVVGVARSSYQFRPTRRAAGRDHVWAGDFSHDRTADGRALKWLSVVDEYTRECLALEVGRGLTGRRVTEVLGRLFAERGVPAHIRSDNGPEFIAKAVRRWLAGRAVEVLYIAPASPWENGYAESFHGRVRDELLAAEEFGSLR